MSTPLPLGKYEDAWVIDAIYSEADLDKPMVELIWRAIPEDSDPDEVFTESSIHRLYGGAKDISIRALNHFGWKPGLDIEVMLDFHGPCIVAEREYKGQMYREAKPFVPFTGARTAGDRKPASVAKSRLAALCSPPGTDPLAAAASQGNGDDIPF